MNNTNISIDLLQSYKARFRQGLINMGSKFSNPLISLTSLKLFASLVTTKNSYELKLRENVGSDNANEHKLTDSEYFFPVAVALGIQKYDTVTGNALQEANFPIFTYADPNYFVGAAAGGREVDALRLIHSGLLTLKQDGTELLKDIATNRFGYTPDGQFLEAAASGNTNDMYPQNGPSLAQRGYGLLYNDHVLKGSNDNEIKINLGAGNNSLIDGSLNAAGAAVTTRNRLVVDVLGFLAHQDLPAPIGSAGKFCQV